MMSHHALASPKDQTRDRIGSSYIGAIMLKVGCRCAVSQLNSKRGAHLTQSIAFRVHSMIRKSY